MTYNEWLEYEVKQLERDKRYWLDNFKRLRDDKIKLIDENEELKKRISNLVTENTRLQNYLFSEQLEQDEKEDYISKLKEKNKTLIELKKIWVDSHRQVTQERDKLSNELTSKIRHEHIQTLEINELKRELKEYRWF